MESTVSRLIKKVVMILIKNSLTFIRIATFCVCQSKTANQIENHVYHEIRQIWAVFVKFLLPQIIHLFFQMICNIFKEHFLQLNIVEVLTKSR